MRTVCSAADKLHPARNCKFQPIRSLHSSCSVVGSTSTFCLQKAWQLLKETSSGIFYNIHQTSARHAQVSVQILGIIRHGHTVLQPLSKQAKNLVKMLPEWLTIKKSSWFTLNDFLVCNIFWSKIFFIPAVYNASSYKICFIKIFKRPNWNVFVKFVFPESCKMDIFTR